MKAVKLRIKLGLSNKFDTSFFFVHKYIFNTMSPTFQFIKKFTLVLKKNREKRTKKKI